MKRRGHKRHRWSIWFSHQVIGHARVTVVQTRRCARCPADEWRAWRKGR